MPGASNRGTPRTLPRDLHQRTFATMVSGYTRRCLIACGATCRTSFSFRERHDDVRVREDCMRRMVRLTALFVGALVPIEAARASPARNVTPTLLSRGTYDGFHVKSKVHEPVPLEFMAKAAPDVDIVVRTHRYGAASENGGGVNSHTGWHTHPGPVFITVKEGELIVFEYDDLTCSNPIVVKAGQGYVDTGRGHIAINASQHTPAVDVTVITAPVAQPFRAELDDPARPECTAWLDEHHREPQQ